VCISARLFRCFSGLFDGYSTFFLKSLSKIICSCILGITKDMWFSKTVTLTEVFFDTRRKIDIVIKRLFITSRILSLAYAGISSCSKKKNVVKKKKYLR